MQGVGLHAACIRVPVGGVECLRQASSSSDPLPTGIEGSCLFLRFHTAPSLFDCKCCLSPPAAFQSERHTAMIDGGQIWESRGSRRETTAGEKKKTQQLAFGGKSATDINAAFVVPAKSLCGKWVEELQRNNGKWGRNIPIFADSRSCGGYQYDNWVWLHSVVVILGKEKQQETRVLYLFSCDMSSLVIQELSVSAVSRSYQTQLFLSTFFFFYSPCGGVHS